MNDSAVRVFGTVLITVAVVLVLFVHDGMETAVTAAGLVVGGCLLRIEAAILRGQPAAPDPPRPDPALAWRRRDSPVLFVPERPDDTRPWHEPEDQDGLAQQ